MAKGFKNLLLPSHFLSKKQVICITVTNDLMKNSKKIQISIPKTTTTNKLAQQRCRRNFSFGYRNEIV